MFIRNALLLVVPIVAGCTQSRVENVRQIQFAKSKTSPPESQVANPVVDDSNSFDPSADVAHEKVVDERAAAVITDYIGLTWGEASQLAKKQNRRTATPYIDGKARPVTAIHSPGRIYLSLHDGIVTAAEFPEGVNVGL